MRGGKTFTLEPVVLGLSPLEVARRLRHLEGFVFLDSAMAPEGALSIIAAAPSRMLQGGLGDVGALEAAVSAASGRESTDVGMPDGAAIGAIDYAGSFHFGIYEELLVYSHRHEAWFSRGSLHEQLREEPVPPRGAPIRFRPEMTKGEFVAAVGRAQEYIAAGDIYQVCLSHRFSASGEALSPWAYYESLRNYSPAPNAAYLETGPGRAICSASPETFLSLSGREIETRPIKGTRPRKASSDEDERSAYDLLTSQKEIAELVMITDLERNDLGRVCEYGSVHVTDLLRLERYEQVFHLVSTVRGTLRREVHPVRALAGCFPGGSITGAPKVRAMEIIDELEPVPRGIYTGAIGYFGFNGESRFSIAIRTAVFEGNRATFHAGAGIVADSRPELEWEETLHKASGLLMAAERVGESG